MEIKFANMASSLLLDNITADATLLSVIPDTGALFPILVQTTDYFKITLTNPGDGSYEIMKVTKTQGDQFTVERAQEGTLALAFPQNSVVENRFTAGSIEQILNDVAATTTNEGRIRIATSAEAKAGVLNTVAMTPLTSVSLSALVGTVTMFAGQLDDDGFAVDSRTGTSRTDWHVCDGTHGTPDLRNLFVIGASSTKAINTSGGSSTLPAVTVGDTVLTTDQMPEHTHACSVTFAQGTDTSYDWVRAEWGGGFDSNPGAGITKSAGKGEAHTHTATYVSTYTPPYYALYYIMKIN